MFLARAAFPVVSAFLTISGRSLTTDFTFSTAEGTNGTRSLSLARPLVSLAVFLPIFPRAFAFSVRDKPSRADLAEFLSSAAYLTSSVSS